MCGESLACDDAARLSVDDLAYRLELEQGPDNRSENSLDTALLLSNMLRRWQDQQDFAISCLDASTVTRELTASGE